MLVEVPKIKAVATTKVFDLDLTEVENMINKVIAKSLDES